MDIGLTTFLWFHGSLCSCDGYGGTFPSDTLGITLLILVAACTATCISVDLPLVIVIRMSTRGRVTDKDATNALSHCTTNCTNHVGRIRNVPPFFLGMLGYKKGHNLGHE